MKIGVRAHDYGPMEIRRLAKTLRTAGYNAIQLAPPKSFPEIESYAALTEADAERIGAAFAENGIELAVLGCYMDLGNPDPAVRENALAMIKNCLRCSKAMGAYMVGTETAYKHLGAEEKREWYPYMLDSVERAVEEAARFDVRFAIEPVRCYPLDRLDTVLRVLETVNDSEHLRLIFDPVNVLTPEHLGDQDRYWREWTENVGSYIDAIHIKDCAFAPDGSVDESLLLGDGQMQYGVISAWLKEENDRRVRAGSAEIALLREGMRPAEAERDIAFLRKLQA